MERRDGGERTQVAPTYAFANAEQAERASELHSALQSQLENTGLALQSDVEQFVE